MHIEGEQIKVIEGFEMKSNIMHSDDEISILVTYLPQAKMRNFYVFAMRQLYVIKKHNYPSDY